MVSPSFLGVSVRKVLLITVLAGALVAAVASIASGATGARCGTRYTKPCTPPHFTIVLSPNCHKGGSAVTLPATTFVSTAGIRRIDVTFNFVPLKTFRFSGLGPTQFTLRGFKISTNGLKAGIYPVTITITDVRGRTMTRTVRFSICRPASKPIFTG
jgi:hypothetical protein